MSKKLTGFDRTLRIWRDEIFISGFEAGAKARVAAGILLPSGELPKRSGKIPDDYSHPNARSLWAYGWKAGYAIATPSTPSGARRMRQQSLAWSQQLSKRGHLRIKKQNLVGCWRASRGESLKVWSFGRDGSATGRIIEAGTVVAEASGKWKLHGDCLVLDYRQNVDKGEKNAPYEDTSVLMDITRDRLVLATSETSRERYTRVPQGI